MTTWGEAPYRAPLHRHIASTLRHLPRLSVAGVGRSLPGSSAPQLPDGKSDCSSVAALLPAHPANRTERHHEHLLDHP